jgi:hypothetical protein
LPQYVPNPIYLREYAPTEPIQEMPEDPAVKETQPDEKLKPIQDPKQLDQGDALTPEPMLPKPPLPVPPAPTNP